MSTEWERYQGKKIGYRLYRTSEMAGYLKWSHLNQVWRVEKEIVDSDGNLTAENRYYVTNLHWGRLKAKQIVSVVRDHWAIENNCNWTMDCIWDEDSKSWSTKGVAIQVLGLIRLMAYNLVGQLRYRYLRKREERLSWQQWLDLLMMVITQEVEKSKGGLRRAETACGR